MDNKNEEVVEQIAKTKKKPRGKNIGETLAPVTEPGDNAKYLAVGMLLAALPDIDLYNADQVKNRLDEFFTIHVDHDLKPSVSGMALALGVDRRRLWEIKTDSNHNNSLPGLPKATSDAIKKAYKILEILWENYMQNGKINPVSGIFLGKNNFGYQDKTEYVLTPNQQNDSDYDADDIKKRYLTDGTTVDSDSNSGGNSGE